MDRPLFKKSDGIFITAILFLALCLFLWQNFAPKDDLYAVIQVDGKQTEKIDLKQNQRQEFLFNGVQIIAEDGKICFSQSDCPDQICVHAGKLEKAGEAAACVPNRVAISVQSGNQSDQPDAISY